MIFREIEIKSVGDDYKLNVTVIFLNLFPIDPTPTGFVHVFTMHHAIDLRITSLPRFPPHRNVIFRPFLSSKSISEAPDHAADIPVHLIIAPDRLNT